MSFVIKAEHIGKRYRIAKTKKQQYQTLRGALKNSSRSMLGKMRSVFTGKQSNNETYRDFWAIEDVSFEIKQGDRIGIVGRNGAGKSTLLKLLSRITDLSEGRLEIRGRVGSLLEVGTGFHPELTGRENIFLNGAILGMGRSEIKKKFDEIVAFSEVEEFLETPVKYYSSGMYVRLAFSVAAHMEPEILIVDEVLAVGDAKFQKKCLSKMESVGQDGRTVLFVSHNMGAVTTLTNKCIYLADGHLVSMGNTEDIIREYLEGHSHNFNELGYVDLLPLPRPHQKVDLATSRAFYEKAVLANDQGVPQNIFQANEPIAIVFDIRVRNPVDVLELHASVNTLLGIKVFAVLSDILHQVFEPGVYQVRLALDPNYLRPGDYYIDLSLYSSRLEDSIRQAVSFRVEPSSEPETNINWSYPELGVVRFPYQWSRPILVQ